MNNISKIKIKQDCTIRDALKLMDEGGIGFCVVIDNEDVVVGVLSDGDFRRAVLNDIALDEEVNVIANENFLSVDERYTKEQIGGIFKNTVVQHIPVIEDGFLIDVITEDSFYGIDRIANKRRLKQSVVIMAGGKGTRLEPFTRILPKPLIPIGDDPILKLIMDKFKAYGVDNFYITLNDKSEMIKAYFYDHNTDKGLTFIEEDKPLGTAGSLKYLQGELDKAFFVTNCDILIESDYAAIIDFHNERNNDLTIVGSMRHHKIPYGVCEINNGGDLVIIKEKPEYNFLINTGMYYLEPDVLKLIPGDVYYDMTSLVSCAQKEGLRVGVFPVSQNSWFDVGQWNEYRNTINALGCSE